MSLSSWDDEYARLARAVSQVRTAGGAMVGANRQHQIGAVRSGLDRIGADLRAIEAGRAAPPPEIGRRRALIEGLRAQIDAASGGGGGGGGTPDLLYGGGGGGGGGGAYGGQRVQATSDALRQQDDMLNTLSSGVGRLRDQTHAIHDEARLHNRLLSEMESDVDAARLGMEEGVLRAQRVKAERNLWRLYMYIAGLSVLLFLLILMGLS